MKIKAKLTNNIVKVKVLAKHEMSTYSQAQKRTGDSSNANFITHLKASIKDEIVFEVSTSQFLSKNPIFKFKFKDGKKGDVLTMTWTDRKGNTKTSKTKIK